MFSKDSDANVLYSVQYFVDGIMLGARLMLEIMEVGKYGILRLRYLHEHRRELYRELLLTGRLAGHCKAIDTAAFDCSERIQADWLADHPMPFEDTLERVRLRTQAQAIADEIVMAELIYT